MLRTKENITNTSLHLKTYSLSPYIKNNIQSENHKSSSDLLRERELQTPDLRFALKHLFTN